MSASDFVQYLSWTTFILIFIRVLTQAIQRPWQINIDVALLFSIPAFLSGLGIAAIFGLTPHDLLLASVTSALLMLLPLLLFRLVDDFVIVRPIIQRSISIGTMIIVLLIATAPFYYPASTLNKLLPDWLSSSALLVFIALLVYDAFAFFRTARQASGVTKRRLQSAGIGSIWLLSVFVIATPAAAFPELSDFFALATSLCGLLSGVFYFVGFSPPRILRRAWQEPELRAFLGRAAQMPRLPDTISVVHEFEQGAAKALGTPLAALGLWREETQSLVFYLSDQSISLDPTQTQGVISRVWNSQKTFFAERNLQHDDSITLLAPQVPVAAALVAPIAVDQLRLGILVIFAAHVPLFADDDLALVQLLADQAAVILESRILIDEATSVQAHAEATRLKEDFLAAAAHDLRTPLTVLIGRAELLERRAHRQPDAPADIAGIQVVVRESHRLRRLIHELLDVARVEQGRLVGQRGETDIVAIAKEVCERHTTEVHPCSISAEDPIVGLYDSARIEQLLENLVGNAVKYSPNGSDITIDLRLQGTNVAIEVRDHGIGIPENELDDIFGRFYRSSNTEGRRFSGMGLGLYICKGIVEQHGGTISVTSKLGEGTTFHIAMPHTPITAQEAATVLQTLPQ